LKQYDITILTDDRYVNPTELNPYIQNILTEDDMVLKALTDKGLKVIRKSWSDRQFDWNQTEFVLFRTTWDYFNRFDEFIRWMASASRKTKLMNPFRLAQWNLDKHYLLDLQKKGIPIVPTHFLKPLSKTTLKEELERTGWINEAILKPSISASSRHTYRLKPHNLANHEKIFQRLLRSESLMIQPFISSILDKGEVSLMIIDGKYTHAVLKQAKSGDFRVQEEFGGLVSPFQPSDQAIELAENAVKACPFHPIYARVDLVWDDNDRLLLSELELIEPDLFFRNNEGCVHRMANAIVAYIQNEK
jgi:glutathione synthase/RimK-type ligase-like ATP-grasp enzyme